MHRLFLYLFNFFFIIIYTLKQLSNYRLLQTPSFTEENALPFSQEDKDVGNQTQPLSVSCFPCG